MTKKVPGNEMLGLSPRSKEILERLKKLYPSLIDLSLGRLEALLEKLGRPQEKLPPVFHVAGTNGKGSTCAFLRALGEAAGLKAHILTSPHLIHVNERFRVAGELVDNQRLEEALAEIEVKNAGAPITVFEVLTAVAFLLFSRSNADFAVIEVGLGGRFDATNLVKPAVTLITPVSFDHQNFLGEDLASIAGEKAGIIKQGIPVYTARQKPEAYNVIQAEAKAHQAPLFTFGKEFLALPAQDSQRWIFKDEAGEVSLPLPSLVGAHQIENAVLAVAAFKAVFPQACPQAFQGIAQAKWPARLQRLSGKLTDLLPQKWELWLDGAHNPHGAKFLGKMFEKWKKESPSQKIYVILGLKEGKKASEILAPLSSFVEKILLVSEPNQYLAQPVSAMQAELSNQMGALYREKVGEVSSVRSALQVFAQQVEAGVPAKIVICGSLYLAGEVLRQDDFKMI
ncbi:bifunctional folylpolyglutamate synthase/dihydrofolate synthase [Acetobacteraceae bacterium]|nr:bifunctional folylpolyglutamate synthase/dihydrofolate synthase [Acetobacteraceae bacterium]